MNACLRLQEQTGCAPLFGLAFNNGCSGGEMSDPVASGTRCRGRAITRGNVLPDGSAPSSRSCESTNGLAQVNPNPRQNLWPNAQEPPEGSDPTADLGLDSNGQRDSQEPMGRRSPSTMAMS